jgi:cytidine deaminase
MADWREDLIAAARQARLKAYAPYSGFTVGAALLSASGALFGGANIENAAYPAGICAERAAFSAALFAGEREFKAIAVVGGPAGEAAAYCWPCGICRQWMAEFCGPDFAVLAARGAQDFQEAPLRQLLPHSFGPSHLK